MKDEGRRLKGKTGRLDSRSYVIKRTWIYNNIVFDRWITRFFGRLYDLFWVFAAVAYFSLRMYLQLSLLFFSLTHIQWFSMQLPQPKIAKFKKAFSENTRDF